jgi:hypothetical protein
VNGLPTKKARAEESAPVVEAEPVALRRDRENSTIVVKNLPKNIAELKVRQFFRDVRFPSCPKKRRLTRYSAVQSTV